MKNLKSESYLHVYRKLTAKMCEDITILIKLVTFIQYKDQIRRD